MSLDDVKKRFVEEVKLRAYDDKYIDKNEEREILQSALTQGVSVDSARAALEQVCEANGYVIERKALDQVKSLMEVFYQGDGKISEKEFNDSVATLKKATNGKRNDVQCKRMVIGIMEENTYQAKTGMFSNWYKRVKGEVGMA